MVKQLLEELQNNFSDHSVAISNIKSTILQNIFLFWHFFGFSLAKSHTFPYTEEDLFAEKIAWE